MALIPLRFRPGVNRDTTNYAGEGGWWDSNRVRFFSGFPQKLGGWKKYTLQTVIGACRQIFNWIPSDSQNLLALGTNQKVYVEAGGNLQDITPVQRTTTPINPFSTTAGSNVVVVYDPQNVIGDGPLSNRYVRITQAYDINGIPASALLGVHEATYIDAFTYSITVNAIATGSGSLDGLSVTGFLGNVTVQTS